MPKLMKFEYYYYATGLHEPHWHNQDNSLDTSNDSVVKSYFAKRNYEKRQNGQLIATLQIMKSMNMRDILRP